VIDGESEPPLEPTTGSSVRDIVRLLGLLVLFLAIPMLLIAAVTPPGCGGG
jgi:hypothetical protein